MTLEYLRSFRIGDFAIFDFATAYLGVYLLVPLLNKIIKPTGRHLTKLQWLYLVLPLSILFHLATNNLTPLTKLAISPDSGYVFKAILIILLYLGLKKK